MSCFVTRRLQFFGAPTIRAEREIKGVTRRYNNSSRRRRCAISMSAESIPFSVLLFLFLSFLPLFSSSAPAVIYSIGSLRSIDIAVLSSFLSSWLINEPAETTLSARGASNVAFPL